MADDTIFRVFDPDGKWQFVTLGLRFKSDRTIKQTLSNLLDHGHSLTVLAGPAPTKGEAVFVDPRIRPEVWNRIESELLTELVLHHDYVGRSRIEDRLRELRTLVEPLMLPPMGESQLTLSGLGEGARHGGE